MSRNEGWQLALDVLTEIGREAHRQERRRSEEVTRSLLREVARKTPATEEEVSAVLRAISAQYTEDRVNTIKAWFVHRAVTVEQLNQLLTKVGWNQLQLVKAAVAENAIVDPQNGFLVKLGGWDTATAAQLILRG